MILVMKYTYMSESIFYRDSLGVGGGWLKLIQIYVCCQEIKIFVKMSPYSENFREIKWRCQKYFTLKIGTLMIGTFARLSILWSLSTLKTYRYEKCRIIWMLHSRNVKQRIQTVCLISFYNELCYAILWQFFCPFAVQHVDEMTRFLGNFCWKSKLKLLVEGIYNANIRNYLRLNRSCKFFR